MNASRPTTQSAPIRRRAGPAPGSRCSSRRRRRLRLDVCGRVDPRGGIDHVAVVAPDAQLGFEPAGRALDCTIAGVSRRGPWDQWGARGTTRRRRPAASVGRPTAAVGTTGVPPAGPARYRSQSATLRSEPGIVRARIDARPGACVARQAPVPRLRLPPSPIRSRRASPCPGTRGPTSPPSLVPRPSLADRGAWRHASARLGLVVPRHRSRRPATAGHWVGDRPGRLDPGPADGARQQQGQRDRRPQRHLPGEPGGPDSRATRCGSAKRFASRTRAVTVRAQTRGARDLRRRRRALFRRPVVRGRRPRPDLGRASTSPTARRPTPAS